MRVHVLLQKLCSQNNTNEIGKVERFFLITIYTHTHTYIYIYITSHYSFRIHQHAMFLEGKDYIWPQEHALGRVCRFLLVKVSSTLQFVFFFHYPRLLKRLPLSNSENEPQHHPVSPIWGRPMIWTPILRNIKIQWFTYHGWHHFPICPYISHIQNWDVVFDSWFLLNPGGIKHLKSSNW